MDNQERDNDQAWEEDDLLAMLADMSPRQHHYVFAHRLLFQMVADDPEQMIPLLCSPKGSEVLHTLWQKVSEYFPEEERLPSDGLKCSTHSFGNSAQVALVTMPRPERITEAHFIAVVLFPTRRTLFLKKRPDYRYITLEYGMTETDVPRTVLCEWSERGHANYGDGPAAEANAFLAAVRRMVEK